ncbi:uncharacterized protein (UPF0548 family) [Frondihabitans sp. PhB188]|uniref:DUF1990 family protein n=1 Tax=Frondihabitans sp. PhB188 TaxID=2485200 RepID=UPI000F47D7ED|nr:DUF1990 domain-containing protein [Frondihabitans sp. PhB188]ROQ41205.1 uncharacterized protein (UPF0548 family) [Frondihabitans sp. PhB188]
MRRQTHTEIQTTYGQVGATQAPDLLQYPPKGFRPAEYRTRIGHGDARFEAAWAAIMTWKVQERSGIRVRVTSTPSFEEGAYTPVTFDDEGNPLDPADYAAPTGESHFSPEGEPFLVAGTEAVLDIHAYGRTVHAPVRVVYVIDDPTRKGFAYGTLDGHPESGEESWVIDQTDDGSVWLTVRVFSKPANWKWRLVAPFLRLQQTKYTQRYLRVLVGD